MPERGHECQRGVVHHPQHAILKCFDFGLIHGFAPFWESVGGESLPRPAVLASIGESLPRPAQRSEFFGERIRLLHHFNVPSFKLMQISTGLKRLDLPDRVVTPQATLLYDLPDVREHHAIEWLVGQYLLGRS